MNETMSTADVMLSIAREALDTRAARDGYEPGAYDTERDPEGYVTSLLNSLHHWCHRCRIDWQRELVQAQGFFEQDLAESEPEAVALPLPTVEELQCPACGHCESFVIEVSECLVLFSDGTVLHGDAGEQWGDASYCRCHACDHAGSVYQFRKTSQERR